MSVDRLDLGDHVCWTFDDDDERLAAMARFVGAGLRSGHRVLYATASVTPEALLAGLQASGVEVAPAAASGCGRPTSCTPVAWTGRAFAPVLTAMGRTPELDRPPLVIDASMLRFADVPAAELLVRAARTAPAGLRIQGCRPAVARTLECVGARDVPGMAVTEAAA